MVNERRHNPRVRVSHPCLFWTGISPTPRLASTVDLSLGGVRFATPYCLITDQMVDLAIAIGGSVISCQGRVVYVLLDVDRPMAGVRFEKISNQDRLHLDEHISNLLEQQSEMSYLS
ncbi:MAG: hypothetical protein GTO12_20140 [Proteobacteria bacterium]|nr:hypothetical protein [Pseudomonadota bacterium]